MIITVSLSVYSDNSPLFLAWVFPTILSFIWRYRIFFLCGCQAHYEHGKLCHILVEGILQYFLVFLIFSFKVLYDLFDVKIHQLGFNNSSKEVWLSCLNTLLSRNVSSFCLVLYFYFFFPHCVNHMWLHCASSRAFLSCLPYPGNSFKNCNMESFFSDSYGALCNFALLLLVTRQGLLMWKWDFCTVLGKVLFFPGILSPFIPLDVRGQVNAYFVSDLH